MVLLSDFMILVPFLQAAIAFTIPEGTSDGVYSVYTDEKGDAIHTLIGNITDPVEPEADTIFARTPRGHLLSRIMRRDDFISCGGTYNMNRADTDAANADLDRQCGTGTLVNAHHNFYSIRGEVVAFFCNFSDYIDPAYTGDKACYASSRRTDSGHITSKCGRYNSGWTTVRTSLYHWSYGYDSRHSTFCGTGA